MTAFLPDNYREPVQSNYMSFEDGDNTFRVLDSAKVGWEYWTELMIEGEKKTRPVRVKEYDTIPLVDVVTNKFGNLNLSFFWAFPVYNFEAQRIQILVIKQKTIRRPMEILLKNPKWGSQFPFEYNFIVTRGKDENGKVFYTTNPEPKEELDKAILDKFKGMKIDMDAWFECNDPFSAQKDGDEASNQVSQKENKEEIITESEKVEDQIPF